MIRYEFTMSLPQRLIPESSWGYWMYSALMERLPSDAADRFHEQGMTPFCQYLLPNKAEHTARWVVTLLTEEAEGLLAPLLEEMNTLHLRQMECEAPLCLERREQIVTWEDFLDRAARLEERTSYPIRVLTPTAFKCDGRYQILPSEHQIVQSLVHRWNQAAPAYALTDADAMRMLEQQLTIRDYRLQSTRFDLKSRRIPGFTGTLWMQSRLPAPMLELWKILLLFSHYAGFGIKTALGMGGVSALPPAPRR